MASFVIFAFLATGAMNSNYSMIPDANRKRPFSYGEDMDPSMTRRRLTLSFLRMSLHERSMGAVIGKSGSLIDQIRVGLIFCALLSAKSRRHCRDQF